MYARVRTCLATTKRFVSCFNRVAMAGLTCPFGTLLTSFYGWEISTTRGIYVNRPRTMAELKDGGGFRNYSTRQHRTSANN